jgi:hypothetical protein
MLRVAFDSPWRVGFLAQNALLRAYGYPDRLFRTGREFEDTPGRTKREVLAAIRRAIEGLRHEGYGEQLPA